MKIVSIVGARPQFIKAGALSREVLGQKDVQEIIVHTGQHYDSNMSAIFFNALDIPKPSYCLGFGGLSHGAMMGRMCEAIEKILMRESPDFTIVYGDTDSTLAGALASVKLHIPIAHIEAGLRSFNMDMPEEINRILTDRISKVLFVPSKSARDNLYNEGFKRFESKIVECGDIMYDVALHYQNKAKKPTINLESNFILSTLHRAENTDSFTRLNDIIMGLREIAKVMQVVLPLHPRTKKKILEYQISLSGICIVEPLGYLEMIWLLKHCKMVATDSGGLQKEAYFFNKPCLVLRDETEWGELLDKGYNVLVGANKDMILKGFRKMSDMAIDFESGLYGDGKVAKKILKTLKEVL